MAEAVRDAMAPYRKQWQDKLAEDGRARAAELARYRGQKA